jgi:RNA polymerase sigma-70 factor (sigma-E family)
VPATAGVEPHPPVALAGPAVVEARNGIEPEAGSLAYVGDFDSFVRERGPHLARFAFLLTGDKHLAEDLVQTALAKVAPRWGRIVAHGDPTPYVRRTLVTTAVGWRRRRWRGETPVGPVPEPTGTDHAAPADAQTDTRERLRRALLELPSRQRATVVLRFYEDLAEAEVARMLGCSIGTVKSQTAKALARLRTLLTPDELGGLP